MQLYKSFSTKPIDQKAVSCLVVQVQAFYHHIITLGVSTIDDASTQLYVLAFLAKLFLRRCFIFLKCRRFSNYSQLSPLEKRRGLYFNQHELPIPKNVLYKGYIDPEDLEKNSKMSKVYKQVNGQTDWPMNVRRKKVTGKAFLSLKPVCV